MNKKSFHDRLQDLPVCAEVLTLVRSSGLALTGPVTFPLMFTVLLQWQPIIALVSTSPAPQMTTTIAISRAEDSAPTNTGTHVSCFFSKCFGFSRFSRSCRCPASKFFMSLTDMLLLLLKTILFGVKLTLFFWQFSVLELYAPASVLVVFSSAGCLLSTRDWFANAAIFHRMLFFGKLFLQLVFFKDLFFWFSFRQ